MSAPILRLLLATLSLSCPAVRGWADQASPLVLGHSTTLSFTGPSTSEDAEVNPFTDYCLRVTFRHPETEQVIRGFYAADGNAADTGASSGSVWQARFAPDRVGTWRYSAKLFRGEDVAIEEAPEGDLAV